MKMNKSVLNNNAILENNNIENIFGVKPKETLNSMSHHLKIITINVLIINIIILLLSMSAMFFYMRGDKKDVFKFTPLERITPMEQLYKTSNISTGITIPIGVNIVETGEILDKDIFSRIKEYGKNHTYTDSSGITVEIEFQQNKSENTTDTNAP